MPTFPTRPTKQIVVGSPTGKLTAADFGISPEVARALQDWAAREQRKLELLFLVAQLRDLLDAKQRDKFAAGPFGPKRTPAYLQREERIAQLAQKLAEVGVYESPQDAVHDAERWLSRKPPLERFQGQPVVAMEQTPVTYTIYTARWGAEQPQVVNRVEQALAGSATRRPQRPVRTR